MPIDTCAHNAKNFMCKISGKFCMSAKLTKYNSLNILPTHNFSTTKIFPIYGIYIYISTIAVAWGLEKEAIIHKTKSIQPLGVLFAKKTTQKFASVLAKLRQWIFQSILTI